MSKPVVLFSKGPKGKPPKDCDCSGGDCACSLPELQNQLLLNDDVRSFDIMRYVYSLGSEQLKLDEEYVVCFGPFHPVTVLNKAAHSIFSSFKQPITVNEARNSASKLWSKENTNATIQKLIAANVLVPEGSTFELTETSKTLTAWLHITDRCNLRCTYCYLPHVRKDMSFSVGCAAIDATFRSAEIHGYNHVRLKYAGGEALLCFPRIVELHEYSLKIAEEKGILVSGAILTNGTLLTPKIARSIQSLGLELMISLDGIGKYHDQQRPYAGGHGTFEDVQRAVNAVLEIGLTPHISITVSGQNVAGLPELLSWVLDRKLPFSINFYRENEFSLTHKELLLDEEVMIRGMLNAYQVIKDKLPKYSLLSSIVDRADLSGPHNRTCGVGNNYLVFNYSGGVSKCQMHLNEVVADAHEVDVLSVIRSDKKGIQNMLVEEKEGCRTCEWKYWCAGGCALATFKATGRFDVKSPNCNIYKAIYPEAIRLEGLRLLKYRESEEAHI